MSNFNQKPIIITAPMPLSFWATLRQLGVLSSTNGKPIIVTSIRWNDPGGGAQYIITDASASQNQLAFGDTPLDFQGADPIDYMHRKWRDWQVTVLNGGTLTIDYD
ncbi:MAG TPA: hypothetical protein VHW72_02810 [Candidatus Angelobacter sp.]|jgi:hypothetical protein|nr:hypothetical protein [Candidatus Angelobacter sp.]